MKSAQEAIERVLLIKCFPKMSKATDLKWLRCGGQKTWPVFLDTDPSNEKLVDTKQGKKKIIKFLGNRMADNGEIQAVSPRNLSDYHNDKDDKSWNTDTMASYMKKLKRHKPFSDKKGQEQQRMLLEEQFFLELLLKKQLEMDDTPLDENDANNEDDDDENEHMFNYTATEETVTVTPSSPASTPGSHHRIITNADRDAQCRKLRAGDVIEYIHPVLFDKRTALILDVVPLSATQKECNATALSMSDGMALPMETEVRLLKRYLRGTLVDNHGALMMFLCDFKLDSSLNDKFKESDFENLTGEKSMADKIRDAYDEANGQVEQEIMKLANQDSDDNEKDAQQHCDRKRTRPEASESTVDQETSPRTPSRPRLQQDFPSCDSI